MRYIVRKDEVYIYCQNGYFVHKDRLGENGKYAQIYLFKGDAGQIVKENTGCQVEYILEVIKQGPTGEIIWRGWPEGPGVLTKEQGDQIRQCFKSRGLEYKG